jgi:hypothetical protein
MSVVEKKGASGDVSINANDIGPNGQRWTNTLKDQDFDAEEARVMKMVKNTFKDYFTVHSYEGYTAKLVSGQLGLEPSTDPQSEGAVGVKKPHVTVQEVPTELV